MEVLTDFSLSKDKAVVFVRVFFFRDEREHSFVWFVIGAVRDVMQRVLKLDNLEFEN